MRRLVALLMILTGIYMLRPSKAERERIRQLARFFPVALKRKYTAQEFDQVIQFLEDRYG